jgi:hypothetical protein
MVKTTEQNIDIVRENIDKLEISLSCADENGLFRNPDNQTIYTDILDTMVAANQKLDNLTNTPEKRLYQGWQKCLLAYFKFNQVLNAASAGWRFKYLFGGPVLIYLFAVLSLSLSFLIVFRSVTSTYEFLYVPLYAYVWGLIGGILQGFWYLWQHVSDRKLRKVWIPWYLLLPFMGAMLGAVTYLLIFAGFVATTGGAQITSQYFPMLLCALAGFSTEWVVETLDKIAESIKIGK